MKKINLLTEIDIRDIVIKELRKRDKLISKGEINILIRQEILKQNKDIYKRIDKLRKRIK